MDGAARTGAAPDGAGLDGAGLDGDGRPVSSGPLLADPRLFRRAAAASFVLLSNDGARCPSMSAASAASP